MCLIFQKKNKPSPILKTSLVSVLYLFDFFLWLKALPSIRTEPFYVWVGDHGGLIQSIFALLFQPVNITAMFDANVFIFLG